MPCTVTTELAVQSRCVPANRERPVVAVHEHAHRARPHDLLPDGRRAAGRHRCAAARQRRAHRDRRHAKGRNPRQRAARRWPRDAAAGDRRSADARTRLAAALCADAPAHRAARHVLRGGGAGHRRQHRADEGAPRFRHRHEPARRREDRARDERAHRARRRNGNRLDQRRGARRPTRARQDDERAAAARRRTGAPLSIPGIDLQPCGGTHVRNIAEIGAIRVLKIRSEGKRNRRVEIALHDNPPT